MQEIQLSLSSPPHPHPPLTVLLGKKKPNLASQNRSFSKADGLSRETEKKKGSMCCGTVSPLKGRTYQAHLKVVVTSQPVTAGPPSVRSFEWRMALARKWVQVCLLRGTVCILKRSHFICVGPPHCLPWQTHLTIFCTTRSCGGGAGGAARFKLWNASDAEERRPPPPAPSEASQAL